MENDKPALRMTGVLGPLIAMGAVGVTSLVAVLPNDLGISVEGDRLIIEIKPALSAITTILVGSYVGIRGRLRASTSWNGKVVVSHV